MPQTVDLPELPKIQFPNVNAQASLNVNASVPEINIPVLPRFDMDFTPPQLPGLPLPQLPDLPPAPQIPEIDKSVQVSVDVMTTIFLHCMYCKKRANPNAGIQTQGSN